MTKKNVLFIWPPLVRSRWLPLGIPFLVAFLKNEGFDAIDVFDMNVAYLQEKNPAWSTYVKMNRACTALKRKSKGKLMRSVYDFLDAKKTEALASINTSFVPWSYNAILASFLDSRYEGLGKIVSRLLDEKLSKGSYSHIFISASYPEQLFFALFIARDLKSRLGHQAIVVLGGSQVTKNIDELKSNPNVVDHFDVLAVREGEGALKALLLASPPLDYSSVPNIYYKDSGAPGVFTPSRASYLLNPEDFPVPDFMGFDLGLYEDLIPLTVAKGCPWSGCGFCSFSSMEDHRFSIGCVEKTLSMIKELIVRHGTREFFFVDSALPPKFMEDLAKGLLRDKCRITWNSNIIMEKAFLDDAFCQLLKKSGLFEVDIGFESASPRVLRAMNKHQRGFEEAEIKGILTALTKAGVKVQLNVIFGYPTETREEALQTLDFLLHNIDLYEFVAIQLFCLEEYTRICEEPEKFGITRIHKKDKNYGPRLSWTYEVAEGMSCDESVRFMSESWKILKAKLLQHKKYHPFRGGRI